MNTRDTICKTLNALMDEKRTTGAELAEYLDISAQAVWAWKTGKSSMSIEHIPSVCKFFDITIDDFFGRSNDARGKYMLLSEEEFSIMSCIRRCDEESRRALATIVENLEKVPETSARTQP